MGLSITGVLLQVIMNNPLAAPNIIGVNAGAGLAVVIILVFLQGYFQLIPLSAFFGAFLTSIVIYLISYRTKASKVTVVLAGVAVSGLLNSIMNAILQFYPNTTIDVSSFMTGSLHNVRYDQLWLPCLYIFIIFLLCLIFQKALNVLMLGDYMATSLGLNVNRYRLLFIIFASTLAGSVVSYAGLIGFVGLIVPHIGRKFVGNECHRLLPFCALFGAFLVVISDLIGRTLFRPYEISVGIILSFLGCPYFIYLLICKRGEHKNA